MGGNTWDEFQSYGWSLQPRPPIKLAFMTSDPVALFHRVRLSIIKRAKAEVEQNRNLNIGNEGGVVDLVDVAGCAWVEARVWHGLGNRLHCPNAKTTSAKG